MDEYGVGDDDTSHLATNGVMQVKIGLMSLTKTVSINIPSAERRQEAPR